MLSEIVFVKGVWEHNRKLWYRSFPFHFGLYLIASAAGLLLVSAALSLAIPTAVAGNVGHSLHMVYTLSGAGGAVLAFAGALGLLIRRLTDPEVRPYTTPGDVFNLAAFLVTLALLVAAYPTAPSLRDVVRGVLTFDRSQEIPGLLAASLIMAALLAAYIPMTQMSHFVGKYFTYHSVRWNDQPNRPALERKVKECLGYRPSWSASHVGTDGAKTWVDVALSNPAQQVKK
jgi:nitrate reductase gamma subunit